MPGMVPTDCFDVLKRNQMDNRLLRAVRHLKVIECNLHFNHTWVVAPPISRSADWPGTFETHQNKKGLGL
eukprot:12904425-Prorocentrum_lima.AAC.1